MKQEQHDYEKKRKRLTSEEKKHRQQPRQLPQRQHWRDWHDKNEPVDRARPSMITRCDGGVTLAPAPTRGGDDDGGGLTPGLTAGRSLKNLRGTLGASCNRLSSRCSGCCLNGAGMTCRRNWRALSEGTLRWNGGVGRGGMRLSGGAGNAKCLMTRKTKPPTRTLRLLQPSGPGENLQRTIVMDRVYATGSWNPSIPEYSNM